MNMIRCGIKMLQSIQWNRHVVSWFVSQELLSVLLVPHYLQRRADVENVVVLVAFGQTLDDSPRC